MSEVSTFISRTGKLTCTPSEIFDFVTDIRNFKQFVPENASINELNIDRESCSFKISPIGNVNVNLSEKEPHNKVVYSGSALQANDFSLILNIKETKAGKAEVQIELAARLNPLLKVMIAKPVDSFLEKVIDEMEKFRDWGKTKL
jgi:carbon monoxide dehydrogenase subunit G